MSELDSNSKCGTIHEHWISKSATGSACNYDVTLAPVWRKELELQKTMTSAKYTSCHTNQPQNSRESEPKFLRLFAGGTAALVATAVTCPLDVIKTRQQSSVFASTHHIHLTRGNCVAAPRLISTIVQPFMHIWKAEGARCLFKGLAPSLIGAVSSRALFFCTYEVAKEQLAGHVTTPAANHVVAATLGGVVCTTATCPLWVIKIRQQLHLRATKSGTSMWEIGRRTWRAEKMRGFFRGLVVSYAGIGELVVYFAVYERLRELYMQHRHGRRDTHDLWDVPGLAVLSGLARCVSCLTCYPSEVVRVRVRQELIQQRYSKFLQTVRDVARHEGVRGLYGGLGCQLVRQALNMAILMAVYETIVYQYKTA